MQKPVLSLFEWTGQGLNLFISANFGDKKY